MVLVNGEVKKLKKDFAKKYPDADESMFEFNVVLDQKTLKVVSTSIMYKASDQVSWDITSQTFKEKYTDMLKWQPLIWSDRGTVTKPKRLHVNGRVHRLPYNTYRFKIYTNETLYFETKFRTFDTAWKYVANNEQAAKDDDMNAFKNIKSVKFDAVDDPYYASLQAAYCISYKGGISREHLTENSKTPKIITSMVRYCVYSHDQVS